MEGKVSCIAGYDRGKADGTLLSDQHANSGDTYRAVSVRLRTTSKNRQKISVGAAKHDPIHIQIEHIAAEKLGIGAHSATPLAWSARQSRHDAIEGDRLKKRLSQDRVSNIWQ